MCVEMIRQLVGVDYFLPLSGFWRQNSGCWQVLLPAEPSCLTRLQKLKQIILLPSQRLNDMVVHDYKPKA